MKLAELKKLISESQGKIIGVKFVKKDGTLRNMCARLGVSKGVKGIIDRKSEDEKFGYLTVFDMNADKTEEGKGNFRRINLNTIQELTINGETYKM